MLKIDETDGSADQASISVRLDGIESCNGVECMKVSSEASIKGLSSDYYTKNSLTMHDSRITHRDIFYVPTAGGASRQLSDIAMNAEASDTLPSCGVVVMAKLDGRFASSAARSR